MLVELRSREPGQGHPPTVLVVDDEPDILDSIETYLTATIPGITVLTAPSAESGLLLLRGRPVDVVVSDLRMPGMDGLEFLTRVRKGFPLIRRILITAFHEEDLDRQAQGAGVGAVLRKPFELESFRDTIHEALG